MWLSWGFIHLNVWWFSIKHAREFRLFGLIWLQATVVDPITSPHHSPSHCVGCSSTLETASLSTPCFWQSAPLLHLLLISSSTCRFPLLWCLHPTSNHLPFHLPTFQSICHFAIHAHPQNHSHWITAHSIPVSPPQSGWGTITCYEDWTTSAQPSAR